MLVSTSKHLTRFQNCSGCLYRLCRAKNQKTFSHFKCLCRQHNTESRATCCPQAAGWTGLFYTLREFPKFFLLSLLKSGSQRKIYQLRRVLEDMGNISIKYFSFSSTCISPPYSKLLPRSLLSLSVIFHFYFIFYVSSLFMSIMFTSVCRAVSSYLPFYDYSWLFHLCLTSLAVPFCSFLVCIRILPLASPDLHILICI